MDNKTAALVPCPFCKGDAAIIGCWVYCTKCRIGYVRDTLDESVELCNTRNNSIYSICDVRGYIQDDTRASQPAATPDTIEVDGLIINAQWVRDIRGQLNIAQYQNEKMVEVLQGVRETIRSLESLGTCWQGQGVMGSQMFIIGTAVAAPCRELLASLDAVLSEGE